MSFEERGGLEGPTVMTSERHLPWNFVPLTPWRIIPSSMNGSTANLRGIRRGYSFRAAPLKVFNMVDFFPAADDRRIADKSSRTPEASVVIGALSRTTVKGDATPK